MRRNHVASTLIRRHLRPVPAGLKSIREESYELMFVMRNTVQEPVRGFRVYCV